MKTRQILIGAGLLLATTSTMAKDQKPFDFYVMSLSWSPEFCQSHPREQQCTRQYGVVLHGVWPQYQSGYPQSCSRESMPGKLVHEFAGLYPNDGLAFHEWKRHGTCSGLSPQDYLQFSQQVKQNFIEPNELKSLTKPLRVTSEQLSQKIIAANPKLNNQSLSYTCTGRGRFLQEIHVCLDKTGNALACSDEIQRKSRRSCGQADFLIRNVR
jgi:ribonuclease T2